MGVGVWMFHDEETVSLMGFLFLSYLEIPICGLSNVRCVLWPHGLGEAGERGRLPCRGELSICLSWVSLAWQSLGPSVSAPPSFSLPSPPPPSLAISCLFLFSLSLSPSLLFPSLSYLIFLV